MSRYGEEQEQEVTFNRHIKKNTTTKTNIMPLRKHRHRDHRNFSLPNHLYHWHFVVTWRSHPPLLLHSVLTRPAHPAPCRFAPTCSSGLRWFPTQVPAAHPAAPQSAIRDRKHFSGIVKVENLFRFLRCSCTCCWTCCSSMIWELAFCSWWSSRLYLSAPGCHMGPWAPRSPSRAWRSQQQLHVHQDQVYRRTPRGSNWDLVVPWRFCSLG